MKSNDERKIDVISGIDDDLLEKSHASRLLLLKNLLHRRQKAWIPWVAMVASLVLVVSALFAILPMLNDPTLPPVDTDAPPIVTDAPSGKQVPVYQGMTVSNEAPEVADDTLFVSPQVMSLSSMGGVRVQPLKDDSGNHYGNDKGNKEHETGIAGVVQDEFPAVLPEDTEYFAKKNEDIYIYIHISNPAKYEILSFTLNGKKYSSYMFEAGSDMETLILKYNVGDVEGTQSYTIDAIKYVDGEDIKDVRMEGDRTVQVHIYPEDQPTVNITEMTCDHVSLTMTPTVTDPLGLIADSQGELYVVIGQDETLVAKKSFVSGEAVTFENLAPETTYDYAVVAVYDAIDGQGKAPHILYKETFVTKPVVAFEDVTIEGLTATFTLNGAESVTALGLYEGETLYRELSINTRVVEHLPIDKEVALVATYGVGDNTYTTAYTLPVIKESEGLVIVDGVIMGIGSCTDTTLYLNHPIWDSAFSGNNFISEVYCGDGVTEIGNHAFYSCENLKNLLLSNNLAHIGQYAFAFCESLNNDFIIPSSVISIGDMAFTHSKFLFYEGTKDQWKQVQVELSHPCSYIVYFDSKSIETLPSIKYTRHFIDEYPKQDNDYLFRGWIGFNQPIDFFGYYIEDENHVIYDERFTRTEADHDLIVELAGEYAVRFNISADLTGYNSGTYPLGFVAKLKDGTVITLLETDVEWNG